MKKDEFLKNLEKRKNKGGRGQGKIAVFGNKELILAALERGYNLKDIFSELKDLGEMPVTYSTFARTVAKYLIGITTKEKPGRERVSEKGAARERELSKKQRISKTQSMSREELPAERTGEIYRPAEIDVEDLIKKSK